jgi:hypothetical protein
MKKLASITILFLIFLLPSNGVSQTWGEIIKLAASDAAESDGFGNSVSISDNGVIIGCLGNHDLDTQEYMEKIGFIKEQENAFGKLAISNY